jgi:hypothetical protein
MTRSLRSPVATTANRRAPHRYATGEARISLQWWDGCRPREASALLLNAGAGGALLLARQPPPLHQAIRLRVEHADAADWLDARVVRLRGLHEVAVAFRDARAVALLGTGSDGARCE